MAVTISTMAKTRAPGSATAETNTKAVAHVLRETMAQLVRKSQQTVQHCGHASRIKAVWMETSQTPYRPLMAYMNPVSRLPAGHDPERDDPRGTAGSTTSNWLVSKIELAESILPVRRPPA